MEGESTDQRRPLVGRTPPTDYERLVRFVARPARRFGLAIARCSNDAVRDGMVAQAAGEAQAAGARVAHIDLRPQGADVDLLDLMRSALNADALEPQVLLVMGLDHLVLDTTGLPRSTPAIEGLNRRRDLLPDLVPAHVVLFVSDAAADALTQVARDLSDIALTFFRFESPEVPRVITRHEELPGWITLARPEEEAKLRREAALLQAVFEDQKSPPSSRGDAAARIGQIQVLLGDGSQGLEWLGRAAEIFATNDEPVKEGAVRGRIADLEMTRGDHEAAGRQLQRVLELSERAGSALARATTLGRMAGIYQARGQLDEALRIRQEEQLPLFQRLGDVRARAITLGQIADIYQARGQLDEALRIRQEDELPVFERLGDVRERAITLGKIADIHEARGQLDEALRIRQEDELPVYERLGDVRERVITLGKIADVYQARGQLDEALRIRQEEQLPVYERLGDVRERAITLGTIADIYEARGQLDEALRIRQEEQLPVFERLGDVRERAVTRAKLGDTLVARGRPGDREKALALFRLAITDAERLGIADATPMKQRLRELEAGGGRPAGALWPRLKSLVKSLVTR